MNRFQLAIAVATFCISTGAINNAVAQNSGSASWQFPIVGFLEKCVTITSRSDFHGSRSFALKALNENVQIGVVASKTRLTERYPGLREVRYRSGGPYCGNSFSGYTCYEIGAVCGTEPRGGSLPCPPGMARDRLSDRCETLLSISEPGPLSPNRLP